MRDLERSEQQALEKYNEMKVSSFIIIFKQMVIIFLKILMITIMFLICRQGLLKLVVKMSVC